MTNRVIEYTVKVYAGDKVYASGDKHWYLDDKLHREDGPACDYANGDKSWYLNGKRHREDGPACDYANGDKSWWLYGKLLTEQEHRRYTTSKPTSCSGKEVVIDGITYVLKEKENG